MQADKSTWLICVSTIGVHPRKGLKSFPQLLLHRQNSCLVLVDHKHEFQQRKLALFLWGHSGIQGFSWQKRFLVCHLSFLTKSLQIPIPLLLAGTLSPELSSGASLGDPGDPCAGSASLGMTWGESLQVELLGRFHAQVGRIGTERKQQEGLHS